MKALILAAGLGSRLKNKTINTPKALVTLKGRPILDFQIEALISNNINEFIIVVGNEGDKIIDFMSSHYSRIKCHFVWNREYKATNSAYSFWIASKLIKNNTYIHICCDIIFSKTLLKNLILSKHENIIATRTDISLTDNMENIVLSNEKIIKMSNINMPEMIGKAYGLAKFSPSATKCLIERIEDYIDKDRKKIPCFGVIREILNDNNFHALDAGNELLMEINTLNDFNKCQTILNQLCVDHEK